MFGETLTNIEGKQKLYKKQYAKRHKIQKNCFKVGDKVQYRNTKNDQRRGGKLDPKYFPINSFLVVKKIILSRNVAELRKPKGKSTYKTIHFNNLKFFGQRNKISNKKSVRKKVSRRRK